MPHKPPQRCLLQQPVLHPPLMCHGYPLLSPAAPLADMRHACRPSTYWPARCAPRLARIRARPCNADTLKAAGHHEDRQRIARCGAWGLLRLPHGARPRALPQQHGQGAAALSVLQRQGRAARRCRRLPGLRVSVAQGCACQGDAPFDWCRRGAALQEGAVPRRQRGRAVWQDGRRGRPRAGLLPRGVMPSARGRTAVLPGLAPLLTAPRLPAAGVAGTKGGGGLSSALLPADSRSPRAACAAVKSEHRHRPDPAAAAGHGSKLGQQIARVRRSPTSAAMEKHRARGADLEWRVSKKHTYFQSRSRAACHSLSVSLLAPPALPASEKPRALQVQGARAPGRLRQADLHHGQRGARACRVAHPLALPWHAPAQFTR